MKLYNLFIPAGVKVPVVVSIPHSGTYVPPKVRKKYRRDYPHKAIVDWHLDKLYDFLPELGITTIQATHSRYVVNLNRGLKEPLFGPESSSVVPYETTGKYRLYDGDISRSEVEERIKKYYLPYHNRLEKLLKGVIRDYGNVYLLDLHSFFAGPTENVCLGNVNETTCSERLIGSFEKALLKNDFSVVRNEKWVGGYITRHYSETDNVETLQSELRFPAYLDRASFEEEEINVWESAKFQDAKKRMRSVFNGALEELLSAV